MPLSSTYSFTLVFYPLWEIKQSILHTVISVQAGVSKLETFFGLYLKKKIQFTSVFIRDTSLWLTSPEARKARYWCLLLSVLETLRVPACCNKMHSLKKSIYDMSHRYRSPGNNTLSQSLHLFRSPCFRSKHVDVPTKHQCYCCRKQKQEIKIERL